ncbi:MAG: glycosyltransferase [Bacteroidales bacterium]|nr:glycosyltransferase [Bacteroidales bacterium]
MQLKVTHLIRAFLPPATSFVRNQIMYHQRYMPSVVYTEKRESELFTEISDEFSTQQLNTRGIGKLFCERFLILLPGDNIRLCKFLKNYNPNILHVHYGVEAILFSKLIRTSGIPALVSFYGHDCTAFPKKFGGFGAKMLKSCVFDNPGVKMITAMSSDMENDLLKLGCPPGKIRIHYHGSDTGRFVMKREYTQKNPIRLLIISLFDQKKGHHFLIDAFDLASRKSSQQMVLEIVGEGPLRNEIRNHILKIGSKNIILSGPVRYQSQEHLNLLREADIFVHPSITPPNGNKEGIPGAIMEAMASGLPVIATRHAGIPVVITHNETGLLIPENDVEALSDAIIQLAEDVNLRKKIGNNGKILTQSTLDVHVKEAELEKLYDEIIQSRSF